MLEVIDLEVDGQLGEIRRLTRHLHVVDVAVVLGDDLGDLGERAGLVDRLHGKPRRVTLRRRVVEVPAQIDPTLRLVLELFERRRVDRVDGDAFARRHDADDAVARHRAAVRRKADRQFGVDTANRNRAVAAGRFELDRFGALEAKPATFRFRRRRGYALVLVVRIHGAHDVGGAHFAAADRRHDIVDRGAGQPRQGAFELLVRIGDLGALAQPLDQAPAEYRVLAANRLAGGAADRGAGLAGNDDRFPGRWRCDLRRGGQNLHLVAILQRRRKRADLAVDLGSDRHVADVGVHRIGKIDRRGAARQRDELTLRGEAEHLVMEQLELGVLEELFGIGAFGQQLDGATQPGIGARLARQHFGRRPHAVLVERVRGDAVFGDLLHFAGADLQLDALFSGPDDGRMKRAVIVLLGRRYVVLEAPGHDRPAGVDDAERLIALGEGTDDDPEAEDIGELLEAYRLALHLAPDRISALAPAGHLGSNALIGQFLGELLLDLGDPAARALGERFEAFADDPMGVGVELAKCQILELLAHLLHAHAAGERRVDVERLFGGATACLRRPMAEGAHVVQPVGELDEQDADVVGNGEQELAQVFRLLGLLGDEVELFQLGEALDQYADVMAEQAVDLGAGRVGVFDRVVQERRRDGGIVELEVGQDRGDLERVRDVGIAGIAHLLAVRAHGVDVGAVKQVLVGLGIILLDPVDQLVLPHEPRPAGGRRSRRRLRPPRRVVGLRHQLGGARHRHAERWLGFRLRQVHRVRHSRSLTVRSRPRHLAQRQLRKSRPLPFPTIARQRPTITISWGVASATRRATPDVARE